MMNFWGEASSISLTRTIISSSVFVSDSSLELFFIFFFVGYLSLVKGALLSSEDFSASIKDESVTPPVLIYVCLMCLAQIIVF